MLVEVDSIVHEQEAMRGQIEFLQGYTIKWKATPMQEKSDQNTLNQLIQTLYYLKEGLEALYGHEDNFMLSKLEFSTADEIQLKHRAVVYSIDEIYRSLVDLSSRTLLLNKENISETIEELCHLITVLSAQENEILKSYTN